MDGPGNETPIGRLLHEVSWEGNARHYRDGGRGRENVLLVEVFSLLDLLPREAFLGEVLRKAHGTQGRRMIAADDAEALSFRVLPGDVRAVGSDGIPSAWAVQPDARLESDRTVAWVEAKRIGRSSFQEHQLARTLAALLSNARGRTPLLLLVLGAPPPVQVQRLGKVSVAEALEHALPHLGPAVDPQRVRDAADAVCWIAWKEIEQVIASAAAAYRNPDQSTQAAVKRIAGALQVAVQRHG